MLRTYGVPQLGINFLAGSAERRIIGKIRVALSDAQHEVHMQGLSCEYSGIGSDLTGHSHSEVYTAVAGQYHPCVATGARLRGRNIGRLE